MSDNPKQGEEKMAKAIFMCADCWLKVFDFLTPSQLGLGIALISHQFNYYVKEHFKTRKWALGIIRIQSKFAGTPIREYYRNIGDYCAKEMEIANYRWRPMPIPQIQMPRNVIGFKCIEIKYIDRNAIAFLHHFRHLFTSLPLTLFIWTRNDNILQFVLHNIWPMIGKNINGIHLPVDFFHRLRQSVPPILNECPSLRVFASFFDYFSTEFPADDSAAASDGQAVVKWLFTPRPDGEPKVFKCLLLKDDASLVTVVEPFKTAFLDETSSPVNFIVFISFHWPFDDAVDLFELTNEFTREQLTLKKTNKYYDHFLLVRCPIARDADKWAKWEKEAIGWQLYDQCNKIEIRIDGEDDIGDGLLGTTPGPSDH